MKSKVFVLILMIFSAFSLSLLLGCTGTTTFCGNTICENGEDVNSCARDCESPSAVAQVDVSACVGPNGNDIYTAGFVSGTCADCRIKGSIGGNTDTCINKLENGVQMPASSSDTLLKFYCTQDGWSRRTVECTNGCENGACKR